MADQREIQRKNQEQAREIRRLDHDLQKKEKAIAEQGTLLLIAKSEMPLNQETKKINHDRGSPKGSEASL